MATLDRRTLRSVHGKVGAEASAARRQAERIAREILDSEEGDVSVATVRERTKAAVEAVLSRSGRVSAEAAALLYDLTMQAEGLDVAPAGVSWAPDAEQIDKVVRYQARHLVAGDRDAFVSGIGEYAENATLGAARDTTTSNVDRDRSMGVRYARVLNEGEYTCEWCVTLASRGFVYSSEDAAAAGSHRGCNCDIEAGVEGQTSIRGVDLGALSAHSSALRQINGRQDISESRKREMRSALVSEMSRIDSAASFAMTDRQFGKKAGKHAHEWGLDVGNAADREKLSSIISDIVGGADEVAYGDWRSQEGISRFYIKGDDVVVVSETGRFVTILKGGVNNERVKRARNKVDENGK